MTEFRESKEEREILRSRLLDEVSIKRLFDRMRENIIEQQTQAKKGLENETDSFLKVQLTGYLSLIREIDILIHILEATALTLAKQNEILYALVKYTSERDQHDFDLRKILEEHTKASDYDAHKGIPDWIDDYLKDGKDTSKDV